MFVLTWLRVVPVPCLVCVSRLCTANQMCLDLVTVSPRFAVEQGLKPDGSLKIRPVDDFTRSGCNAATDPSGALVYESIDALLASIRAAKHCMNAEGECNLSLWKADIDSAYRRIPIAPEHRHLAWVAFVSNGQALLAQHTALPFGSVASVYHWDELGELIKAIARSSNCVMRG